MLDKMIDIMYNAFQIWVENPRPLRPHRPVIGVLILLHVVAPIPLQSYSEYLYATYIPLQQIPFL